MMEKQKNLYKLDDICLFLSLAAVLVLLYQFRPLLPLLSGKPDGELLGRAALDVFRNAPLLTGLLLFSALFLQVIGRVVRRREIASLKVIDALTNRSRVSLHSLAAELQMDEAKLLRLVRQLTGLPGCGVQYDGTYVRIERKPRPGSRPATVRASRAVRPAPSAAAAARNRGTVVRDASLKGAMQEFRKAAEASRAGNPGGKTDLKEAMLELRKAAEAARTGTAGSGGTGSGESHAHIRLPERDTPSAGTSASGSGMVTAPKTASLKPNPVILLILFIAFWPAAVIYVMSFYLKNVQKKAIQSRLGGK